MFQRFVRPVLIAAVVLCGGLFVSQTAQAQGFAIGFGGGGYDCGPYGCGYPGYIAPIYPSYGYGPYSTGYRGGYFPYNSYRANISPYIRHYGYGGCW